MSDTIAVSAQRSIQQQRNQVIATPKCGGRGQLGLASATLYTVPTVANAPVSHPKAILKSIVLCNTDSSARTVTIYLDRVRRRCRSRSSHPVCCLCGGG
jgi:hypothetical protein